MDLVNELQISVEQDDVLTVLRKARRLASKLDVDSISDWLSLEQNGYKRRETVPSYRMLSGSLVYQTNGLVPAGYGRLVNGLLDVPGNICISIPVYDSVAEILQNLDGAGRKNQSLYIPARDQEKIKAVFQDDFVQQYTFHWKISPSAYGAIVEIVKDRVLDWACQLERSGVRGEGVSFDAREKAAANSIVFNITGSQIEQLNNSGTNIRN